MEFHYPINIEITLEIV